MKYRKALLRPDVENELVRIAGEIRDRYAIEFEQMGCDQDHIHLLCSAHPKISIGSIVRTYKSITARELFKTFPSLKRDLWGGEFWSDGYYAATVGERNNWETVYKYVQKQGKQAPQTLRRFAQLSLPEM